MTNNLEELVRDLTKTMPVPVAKSYAKKRILEFMQAEFKALEEGIEGMKKPAEESAAYDVFNQALDEVKQLIRDRRGR